MWVHGHLILGDVMPGSSKPLLAKGDEGASWTVTIFVKEGRCPAAAKWNGQAGLVSVTSSSHSPVIIKEVNSDEAGQRLSLGIKSEGQDQQVDGWTQAYLLRD